MPFAVKLRCRKKDPNSDAVEIEVPWWDEAQLRRDARFVPCGDHLFRDFVAKDLCNDDIRELHDQFLPQAGVSTEISKVIDKIDLLLVEEPQSYECFDVVVFEWESGLD